jgi:hypothetical protein
MQSSPVDNGSKAFNVPDTLKLKCHEEFAKILSGKKNNFLS